MTIAKISLNYILKIEIFKNIFYSPKTGILVHLKKKSNIFLNLLKREVHFIKKSAFFIFSQDRKSCPLYKNNLTFSIFSPKQKFWPTLQINSKLLL